jgi:hypothetical protein
MLYLIFKTGYIAFACFLFYILKPKNNFRYKKIFKFLFLILLGVAVYKVLFQFIEEINQPNIWDFGSFYLFGKVASLGMNYYNPDNFHIVYNQIAHSLPEISDAFVSSLLNVGFLYPPPTILYFAPLGLLTFKSAVIVWSVILLIMAILCFYSVWHIFLKNFGQNGLILAGILFFSFPSTIGTIQYLQTNFFLLFYLLMMYRFQEKKYSGIFLAIAVFTKPYMIIFSLYFLLRKKWGSILYAIYTGIILSGVTFLIFGKDVFINYFLNGPTNRIPEWVYSEEINQSLSAVLIRHGLLGHFSNYTFVVLIVLAIALMFLFYLLKKRLYDFMWSFLLIVALLVYPGTLSYYGTLLVFIITQFFSSYSQLRLSPLYAIICATICFSLASFSVFGCILFLLGLLIFKAIFYNTLFFENASLEKYFIKKLKISKYISVENIFGL